MNYIPYLSMLIAAALILFAALKLHGRVQTFASLALCLFGPLAVIYHPFSLWLFGQVMNDWPSWMSNWLLWIAVDLLPSLLVLVAGSLFLLSTRKLERAN